MIGRHIQMLETLKLDIERLSRGAVFHAEDMDDIEATENQIKHHSDAIALHIKVMKEKIDDFGRDLL